VAENTPVGQAALIAKLGLRVPPPAVTSVVGPGIRRTTVENGRTVEKYTQSYAPEDTFVGHLKFALRYEPLELGVLVAAFKVADGRALEAWVRAEPTGAYARRAWFLYEWLTGKTLDLPDAGVVTYADALNSKLHLTATKSVPSKRHKITDNILGRPGFAPTVRRTPRLEAFQAEAIDAEARRLIDGCDPEILARAINYLYTKETKSSFQIENETVTGQRAERFVAALRSTRLFDATDRGSLMALQNTIVDPRYAAKGYRDFQNFVGETVGGYREVVHYICPRPEDVHTLMSGWAEMATRLQGAVDPVVAAALVSFGFAFIHPFEDGNGRIHRFLMHHVLSTEGFTPPDILFPVSAAIVRDRKGYDVALETFSRAIQPNIDWHWTPEKEIEVENDTSDLYRYWDATALAEYLYAKVAETVRKDLKEELDFVGLYDAALEAVRERIDMPDRRASLLVRCLLQNHAALSKKARAEFAELTDDEVVALQIAVRDVMENQEPDADGHP
jgi:Fic family protein